MNENEKFSPTLHEKQQQYLNLKVKFKYLENTLNILEDNISMICLEFEDLKEMFTEFLDE